MEKRGPGGNLNQDSPGPSSAGRTGEAHSSLIGCKPQMFILNIKKVNRPLSCSSFNPSASRNRHSHLYMNSDSLRGKYRKTPLQSCELQFHA